jgi:hypothetical protein
MLTGTVAKIVLVLALLAGAAFFFREPLEDLLGIGGGAGPGRVRDVLVVGIGDGGFATLAEALVRAKPGQRIEVAPGEYHERIVLRDGVALVSRSPRGAVLLPPLTPEAPASPATPLTPVTPVTPAMRAVPAITANGVHGARLSGFKVLGTAAAPWSVGVRLDGSEVELDGVEVTGTTGAGIDIRGADRSIVRLSYVHGNGGAGFLISGDAAPRLQGNLIAGNGARPGALAPGVEVRGAAVPLLTENRIEGNGGAGVLLPSPERAEEVFRWNNFGAVPREQAVRSAAGVSAAAASPSAPSASAESAAASAPATAGASVPKPTATPAPAVPSTPPAASKRAPRSRP